MWRLLSSAQVLFKLGPPRFALERFMRGAIKECPEVEGLRGWLLGELRRGDPIGVHQAGLALGRYDARPWVDSLDVPAAVVITTRDRLVRPKKQRHLAHALADAHVLTLPGDHDAALVQPVLFRAALREAIEWLIDRRYASASGHRDLASQAGPT